MRTISEFDILSPPFPLLNWLENMSLNESNIKSFKQLIKTPRKSVIARSEKQSEYIKALKENDIVMSLGPAGTGKSFLAVSVAVTLLMEKKIERVILSRPAVEAGEKLGFLPGDMKEKVDPYLRPLYDALYELFGADKIDKRIESGEDIIGRQETYKAQKLDDSFPKYLTEVFQLLLTTAFFAAAVYPL